MSEALRELMADDLKKAELKGKNNILIELVHDGLLDANDAAKRANMSLKEFNKKLNDVYSSK
jgi:hypothetical protein